MLTRDIASPPTRWQENHGNLLMVFVAIVMVIGVGILFYRQSRFVPPRFPEANMIETPVRTTASEENNPNGEVVTIKVSGAISDNGFIKIDIYRSEVDFVQAENAVASNSSLIFEGESVWAIPLEELPAKFAVAAFHDENGDNTLNLNRVGIPTERYGYSQNTRGLTTGPPSFKRSVISAEAGKTIELFIR